MLALVQSNEANEPSQTRVKQHTPPLLQARVQGLETEVQDLRKQLQAMQLDRTNQQAQLDQLSRVALRGVAVEPPPPPAKKTVGPYSDRPPAHASRAHENTSSAQPESPAYVFWSRPTESILTCRRPPKRR